MFFYTVSNADSRRPHPARPLRKYISNILKCKTRVHILSYPQLEFVGGVWNCVSRLRRVVLFLSLPSFSNTIPVDILYSDIRAISSLKQIPFPAGRFRIQWLYRA